MNKAITDGIVFMPPAFENGLGVWSAGDGTPGSPTYDGSGTGAFVPSDADFGGCLEILKINSPQQLRYMGQTPILPGCYLQIKARVKAISGPLPEVRIAAWAGAAGDTHLTGVIEQGPATQLTSYGAVTEITAIVGTGRRPGVDMAWGVSALYGHFGIDVEGANGAVIRVDDLEVTDVTGVFLREIVSRVDVRDYGAVGDGIADARPRSRRRIRPLEAGAFLCPKAPIVWPRIPPCPLRSSLRARSRCLTTRCFCC